MINFYVLMGAPGSGKSTFAKTYLKDINYVSRDEIRFSLLQEDEDYFAREKETYREFVWAIYDSLNNKHEDVIADATHLTDRSRAKLFSSLPLDFSNIKVIGVFVNTPLTLCLERNEQRKNTKTYVPRGQVRRMYNSCVPPTFQEYNKIFSEIWDVHSEHGEYNIKRYDRKGEIK